MWPRQHSLLCTAADLPQGMAVLKKSPGPGNLALTPAIGSGQPELILCAVPAPVAGTACGWPALPHGAPAWEGRITPRRGQGRLFKPRPLPLNPGLPRRGIWS